MPPFERQITFHDTQRERSVITGMNESCRRGPEPSHTMDNVYDMTSQFLLGWDPDIRPGLLFNNLYHLGVNLLQHISLHNT